MPRKRCLLGKRLLFKANTSVYMTIRARGKAVVEYEISTGDSYTTVGKRLYGSPNYNVFAKIKWNFNSGRKSTVEFKNKKLDILKDEFSNDPFLLPDEKSKIKIKFGIMNNDDSPCVFLEGAVLAELTLENDSSARQDWFMDVDLDDMENIDEIVVSFVFREGIEWSGK